LGVQAKIVFSGKADDNLVLVDGNDVGFHGVRRRAWR
jgi:hypothetical protein